MTNLLTIFYLFLAADSADIVFPPFSLGTNLLMIITFLGIILVWFFLWHHFKISINKVVLAISSGIVLIAGTAVYFIGFSEHKGLGFTGSWMGNFFLSMLSSFKMFAFDSDLELIGQGRENPLYMAFFGITHAAAASISTIFIINYFGVKLASLLNRLILFFNHRIDRIYVFFGVDEHSMSLAEDIRGKNGKWKRDVIVFVDTAIEDEEQESGISSLIGNFRYRRELLTKINSMDALLIHNRYVNIAPDMEKMRKKQLRKQAGHVFYVPLLNIQHLLDKADEILFFAMSGNEILNINTMCNIVSTSKVNRTCKFYCHAFRENSNMQFEKSDDKDSHFDVRIIDSSYLSAMDLKTMTEKMTGEMQTGHLNIPVYKCHPINFVEVENGLATTDFNAAVIGFGQTGVSAFNFIYEFGQFPYADRSQTHFSCHVFDRNMGMLKGRFLLNEPGMRTDKCGTHLLYDENSMIHYHDMDTSSDEFWQKMTGLLPSLNYVVICLGEDEQDIDLAADIYELAVKTRGDRRGDLHHFKIFLKSYEEENEIRMERTFASCHDVVVPFGKPSNLFKYHLINDTEIKRNAEQFCSSYDVLYNQMNNSDTMSGGEKARMIFALDPDRDHEVINKINRVKKLRTEAQNISNAYHIYTKLKLLGVFRDDHECRRLLKEIKQEQSSPANDGQFDLSNFIQEKILEDSTYKNILRAAMCEHMRWNASHLALGYIPMNLDVFRKYFKCSYHGKVEYLTADDLKKQHVCITDWDKLYDLDLICYEGDKVKKMYECYDVLVVLTSLYMTKFD